MKKGFLLKNLIRVIGLKLILLQGLINVSYYYMDFIFIIGTCKDSLASASHSELTSKFSESLWKKLEAM